MTDHSRCIVACAGLFFAFAYAPIGVAQDGAVGSQGVPQGPGRDRGPVLRPVEERKNVTPIPPPPPGSEPPSPDPRKLEGIWLLDGEAPNLQSGPPPQLTPKAAAERAERRRPLGGECRPSSGGILNIGWDLFPAEVIQTPDKIVILNEEGRGRWQIFLNRALPNKQPTPSYSGYSVGHWDDDTLVVETVGISGQLGMAPLTKNSRVTHRLRKLDGGKRLEMKTITEDPEILVTPYQTTKSSIWHPELQLLEFQCEENREGAREGVLSEG